MRILAILIVPLAIWFACVIVWLWLPLPAPLPPAFGDLRNKIAAVLTGFAGVGFLVFLVWYLFSVIGETGSGLDSTLEQAGLAGEPYLLVGRRYSGTVAERQIVVEFMPERSMQRPMLNAYVTARTTRRLSAGWTKPLLGCVECTRVQTSDPRLSGLTVKADDPSWTARLLSTAPAVDLVWQLLADPEALGARFVHVEAGRVWLQARPTQAGLARSAEWVAALARLAAEAERAVEER
jgi:hypothetical protein